jgi:hypothetical protein
MSVIRGSVRGLILLGMVIVGNALGAGIARAQNVSPVISGVPPTSVNPGARYDFRPSASDANGDRLRFSVSGAPAWAKLDGRTGRLYGSPSQRHLGMSSVVTLCTSDGKLSACLPQFTLRVVANASPTIGGVPATSGRESQLYVFEPVATDPDGDALKFSIVNKPGWASFTSSTGLLSGIPPVGSAGTYSSITISVTDGQTTRSLAPFSISIAAAPNQPPTIWGVPPASVAAGTLYSFKPSASDPENNPLTFTISGLPTWATFDTRTGTLSGTPSAGQAGKYSSLVISVSDGKATAALAPFSIDVTATNRPPTISGAPAATVAAGRAYSFTPTASDPDGQRLTFTIANKPGWASFDAASGRLYGTPADANVGTYSSIQISVTDGQYSATLPAFSIAVQKSSSGTATLSWVAPTTNVDGTPVTNLGGYRIAYGQTPSNLAQSLDIPSAVVTSAVIENLAAGTWYFAVKAYTTANVESDLSNLAQKTVF